MVMLCHSALERIYQLCDEGGHPIGRIVGPRAEEFLGPRAGTVLLVREMPTLRSDSPSSPLQIRVR